LSLPAVDVSGASRFSRQVLDNPAATGDLTAVRRWLQRHASSTATLRAYTKESERFLLWCLHLPGKPVLSIDVADCAAYCRFLAEVPTDWIEPHALPRSHPAWKPFRGPLKPASQRHALVVVQDLFDGLRESNPDRTNPMAEARRQAAAVDSPVATDRSISDADWTWLLAQVDRAEAKALLRQPGSTTLRAGAVQRRLRLILCLLRSTGLRLSELVAANTADVGTAPPEGAGVAAGVLTVHGCGARQRKLPLSGDVLSLLADHHADAAALGALPCPAPIICTLRPELSRQPTAQLASGTSSEAVRLPAMSPNHRRLGANGVYRLLKRFFARASAQAQALDAPRGERVLAASTHWLRHTFGEQGVAGGMSMTALQQALGHASPGSARRYGKARESSTEPRALDHEKGEGVGPSNPLPHESS
jgi:site-specific recombinase XerD